MGVLGYYRRVMRWWEVEKGRMDDDEFEVELLD